MAHFLLTSPFAKRVDLLLIKGNVIDKILPMQRSEDHWEIAIDSINPPYSYAFSIDGSPPCVNLNSRVITLDPLPATIVNRAHPFDWGQTQSPNRPLSELIIYEMHVKGFTQDPRSGVKHPGTFLGIIEKIPYLLELGINAIELMPITAFDPKEHLEDKPLKNYWGYAPITFASIHSEYGTPNDLKTLVKALHEAGIEIILDLVFNHTGRPDLCFETIDRSGYYILDSQGNHMNYTGCGHTFNANSSQGQALILDALKTFVTEFHIDGFRFDLASSLTRDPQGHPLTHPPLIKAIAECETLKETKLIAEPWDMELYQVGSFPHFGRFAEWNGHYRDTVRRFLKGTDGTQSSFSGCITGSEDLYGPERSPAYSINFVTAHDGFTLSDLVTYQEKHNEANLENNEDGSNYNESWNCGIEGPTDDATINALRLRRRKNFILALLTSLGTPMLTMGDEYGHTRSGNNNPWCQDNAINHFDWERLELNRPFFDFVKQMIALRKKMGLAHEGTFYRKDEIDWHGTIPFEIDWSRSGRFIALTVKNLYIAYNSHYEALPIELPPSETPWQVLIDTSESFDPSKPTMLPYSAIILSQ